jgi:hypothetical protein
MASAAMARAKLRARRSRNVSKCMGGGLLVDFGLVGSRVNRSVPGKDERLPVLVPSDRQPER